MTSVRILSRAAVIIALGLAHASTALAQGAEVRGRWVIAKAALAPWAEPSQRGVPEEERRLVGRTVTFGPRSETCPDPLGRARAPFP